MVFPTIRRRGRGLDPGPVYAYLATVAEALAARDRAVTTLDGENARIKEALAQWQSRQPDRLPQRQPILATEPVDAEIDDSGIRSGRPDAWPGWNASTHHHRPL